MSQERSEQSLYRRDEGSVHHQHHYRLSHHQQQHTIDDNQMSLHHQSHSKRPQDRYQDPHSEHPQDRYQDPPSEQLLDQTSQYYHASNATQAPTSMHVHYNLSLSSTTTYDQFSSFSQSMRRASLHFPSAGQNHHSQQHIFASHSDRHHSIAPDHPEHTAASSHANENEINSSTREFAYGIPGVPASHLSLQSSNPASALSSGSSSAQVASDILNVPEGSTTLSMTTTTTASGDTKTTRRRRRPNESYSTIIIKAIRNSPLQRLKLSEIYDYVSREIPSMDGNDKGWQNTVRHNLSHNKCFRRIVIKDEDLPSGSADDEDTGDPKHITNKSKQTKRGKGGCWVLVTENLEESMTSSRPKKSSMDQSSVVHGAESGPLSSTISPKREHATGGGNGIVPRTANVSGITSSSGISGYVSPQLLKSYSLSHAQSGAIDIDRNVASMVIADQRLFGQHSGHYTHSSHHIHPPSYSRQYPNYTTSSHGMALHEHQNHPSLYPYPLFHHHMPSSSSSNITPMAIDQSESTISTFQPILQSFQPGQYNSNSNIDDRDHDSGQSEQSMLLGDREFEEMNEDIEEINVPMEDNPVTHPSSSHQPPSYSLIDFSAMDIEEADSGTGGFLSSTSPITERRSGMSIQNMLN
ncbi:Forkhead box protein I2 [Linnemannia zychae]|nr:Forkhead box protein I2 [Linnemannia zychae]